ncbi:MAG: hypothetical protein ACKVP3_03165 [Hyphomicrobiaceae bacterium]
MTEPQFQSQAAADHVARGADHNVREGAETPRSSYGQIPGEELPAVIYVSALLSFAGLLAAAWLLFDRNDEIGLDLMIATVLFTAMLGLPLLLARMVSRQTQAHSQRSGAAPSAHVEIYTGTLSIGEAWLQILLIPLAMAFAAVAIGVVSLMVS